MKQSQAVYNLVTEVVGKPSGKVELTQEQRTEIISRLMVGFSSGEIALSEQAKAKYADPKALRSYCSGLLNNWLRKDPDLNGGVKYTSANPGIRSGSPEHKQAQSLKKHLVQQGQPVPQELEDFIKATAPTPKVKTKEVDLSSLPEHLKALAI